MPRKPNAPQPWMPYFRRIQNCSLDELAERTGGQLSKVFLSKIERGERNPSEDSKRLIVRALRKFPKADRPKEKYPLAYELLPGLTVNEVFPTDGRRNPDEAVSIYLAARRAGERALDSGVSEERRERDYKRAGLEPDEHDEEIAHFIDDETLVVDFSSLEIDKSVTSIRFDLAPVRVVPRPRQARTQRKRQRSASSSSSDDPGGEPDLGRPARGLEQEDFVGAPSAKGVEGVGTATGKQAVAGAARSKGQG